MKRLWLLFLFLCALPQFSIAQTCDHYADSSGTGSVCTEITPCLINSFWAIAVASDTLCLNDGTYQGANSMIVPTSGLSGTSGNPITVRALNDGLAIIDGQGVRRPVDLNNNSWFVLKGFDAHDSNDIVIRIRGSGGGDSTNVEIKRVVAWDGCDDCNSNIIQCTGDSGSSVINLLLEDVAAFGIGRKVVSFGTGFCNDSTCRRCWGRWEGNTNTGPKMVYTLMYNHYRALWENTLGTWYTQTGLTGSDMGGIWGMDGPTSSQTRDGDSTILSSIGYIEADFGEARPRGIFEHTTSDHFVYKNLIAVFEPGQSTSREGFRFFNIPSTFTVDASPGEISLDGDNLIAIGGNCVDPGDASVVGGDPCTAPSDWTLTNIEGEPTLAELSASPWTDDNFCLQTINEVLQVNTPLWPWSMKTRIANATASDPESPDHNVHEVLERLLGVIPVRCKRGMHLQFN